MDKKVKKVIVLIEPSLLETQKERCLRLSADDKQLEQARKEFANEQWVELQDDEDLDVLLKNECVGWADDRKPNIWVP